MTLPVLLLLLDEPGRDVHQLHAALQPYLHDLTRRSSHDGSPLMRPLWLERPHDPTSWTVEDQYLLGPSLLVAPVVHPGATSRPVYLPPGAWRDYWTGAVLNGSSWVSAEAPLDRIPLFVAADVDLRIPSPAALGLP